MNTTILGYAVLLFGTYSLTAADDTLTLRIPAGPHQVLRRVEVGIDGVPDASNPFDPAVIAVDLEATTPSGKRLTVPAFWGRDFDRDLQDGREVLTPHGEPGWRARYLPLESGEHDLEIVVHLEGQRTASATGKLQVEPANRRGLVRADPDSRYFRFDDGTPLFLNGLCACWHGRRGTFDYDDWLAAYEKSGINYIRLWMWPHAFGIEWGKEDRLQYRLDNAWTLDRVLAEAERRGVVVMLCFDYHGMYEEKPDYWNSNNYWPQHPYNSANGGPCANQDEFFTSAEARELYRKRLRYIIARWTAFPNVMAWEFFNEIDNVYRYLNHEHVIHWHQEMGAHLRSIDPYQHIVTSSFTGGSERADLFSLEEMEFSQYHSYNEKYPAEMIAQKTAAFWQRYQKPFYVSEYGTDWKGWKPDTDPHLRALHQAIWSGAFTGAAGTGMTWWWESIHSQNLYRHWSALAKFLDGTAIAAAGMQPAEVKVTSERAKAWAVATKDETLVWVLNPAMNWPEGAMVDDPEPLAEVELNLERLENGNYSLEWWDTLQGTRLVAEDITAMEQRLTLAVPAFRVDIAGRIRKL